MKHLTSTIFLAALSLSFASGEVMVRPINSVLPADPFVTVLHRTIPNLNVVPSSVATSIIAHDSSPVTDPIPVRHGINPGSNEYLFAIKPCSATDVACGEHIALNVSTGCPGCASSATFNTAGDPTGVPEPAVWALVGLGLTGLFFVRRRADRVTS